MRAAPSVWNAFGLLLGGLLLSGCQTPDPTALTGLTPGGGIGGGPASVTTDAPANKPKVKVKPEKRPGDKPVAKTPKPSTPQASAPSHSETKTADMAAGRAIDIASTPAAETSPAAQTSVGSRPGQSVADATDRPPRRSDANPRLEVPTAQGRVPASRTTLSIDTADAPAVANKSASTRGISVSEGKMATKTEGNRADLPAAGEDAGARANKTPLTLKLGDWLTDDAAHLAWRKKRLEKITPPPEPAAEQTPPAR